MADKEGTGKGNGGESGSSGWTWPSTKKEGSVIPKERKHVSQLMGEKIVETFSSGVKNIKNKNKIKPADGSGN